MIARTRSTVEIIFAAEATPFASPFLDKGMRISATIAITAIASPAHTAIVGISISEEKFSSSNAL